MKNITLYNIVRNTLYSAANVLSTTPAPGLLFITSADVFDFTVVLKKIICCCHSV